MLLPASGLGSRLLSSVTLLLVIGVIISGGDAHQNQAAYAPGVPPPRQEGGYHEYNTI